MEYLIIAFLWAAYCALHSYLISVRFTKLMTYWLKSYYSFYRFAYIIISIVLIIPLFKLTAAINDPIIISYYYPFSIIRYILISGSLLMFFWAFFLDYDSLSFFGFRQIMNFKKKESANPSEKFKIKGLLGITRHPMYFALIIYLWCQTFTTSGIVVNSVLTIYIFIGTILEEKKLVLEFKDLYIKYQQQVPMLIPFIKIQFVGFNASKEKALALSSQSA
jgi:methanethiol S-methyltransferase